MPSYLFFSWLNSSGGPGPPRCRGFKFTIRHTTFARTPQDVWSGRARDLYLTTHNTVQRKTTMPPAGFKPTIPASATDTRLRPRSHSDQLTLLAGSLTLMLKSLHTQTHTHTHTNTCQNMSTPTSATNFRGFFTSNVPQDEIQIYYQQRRCKILTVVINGGRTGNKQELLL